MKTLTLLRHAKTEPSNQSDWHRELLPRGHDQARSLGSAVAAAVGPRVYVLVSTAQRAMQTWEAIAPAVGEGADVHTDSDLYTFDAGDILQIIRAVDDDEASVMVVGHNPGISELAAWLTGEPLPDDDAVAKWGAFRTGRGAVLSYNGDWAALAPRDCTVVAFLTPTVD